MRIVAFELSNISLGFIHRNRIEQATNYVASTYCKSKPSILKTTLIDLGVITLLYMTRWTQLSSSTTSSTKKPKVLNIIVWIVTFNLTNTSATTTENCHATTLQSDEVKKKTQSLELSCQARSCTSLRTDVPQYKTAFRKVHTFCLESI